MSQTRILRNVVKIESPSTQPQYMQVLMELRALGYDSQYGMLDDWIVNSSGLYLCGWVITDDPSCRHFAQKAVGWEDFLEKGIDSLKIPANLVEVDEVIDPPPHWDIATFRRVPLT